MNTSPKGSMNHTHRVRIVTELTAITGCPLPGEQGYVKFDDHDAQGFIRIARNLLPLVDTIYNAHDALLEACKEAYEISHDPKVERILQAAIAKAEGGDADDPKREKG